MIAAFLEMKQQKKNYKTPTDDENMFSITNIWKILSICSRVFNDFITIDLLFKFCTLKTTSFAGKQFKFVWKRELARNMKCIYRVAIFVQCHFKSNSK